MEMRLAMDTSTDRLLLNARNGRSGNNYSTFISAQTIGKNTFTKFVQETFAALGNKGDGASEKVTLHGLRASMTTFLQEEGVSDSVIALRTGHKHANGLKSYVNFYDDLGKRQFNASFAANERDETGQYESSLVKEAANAQEIDPTFTKKAENGGINNVNAPHSKITINVFSSIYR